MKPHFTNGAVDLFHGDSLDVLRGLGDATVDAVVTDPPYGIGFMGKEWDQPGEHGSTKRNGTPGLHRRVGKYDHQRTNLRAGAMEAGRYDFSANTNFQAWCTEWTAECLRILKPGGHLLTFGGSRTWHRLAAAVEDAGFEIRDSIAWLYGSGFPKSLDVSKAIDKKLGVADEDPSPVTPEAKQWQGWGTALKPAFEPIVVARKPLAGTVAAGVLEHGTGALNIDACRTTGVREDSTHTAGRWPTNVALDDTQAAELDQQAGIRRAGERPANRQGVGYHGGARGTTTDRVVLDSGGASRFFPVFRYQAKAPAKERPKVAGIAHPTVKPLELMRWLVRLVTPAGGLVLDPFAGSGTTGEACTLEDLHCLLIEREADYLPLIVDRLTKTTQLGLDFDGAAS